MIQGIENRIDDWRTFLLRSQSIQVNEVDELEDHLRSIVLSLEEVGLEKDEAFLVAVKRLGDLNSLSREFAQEYSERLWKQLVISNDSEGSIQNRNRDVIVAVGLALASGAAIKLPELFGIKISETDTGSLFYIRNLSFFVLPFIAGYFAWKREIDLKNILLLAIPFIIGGLVINLLPERGEAHTLLLAAMHLPIALWLAVGLAYISGHWRNHDHRMNFVRFTGEWFIYFALVAMGGGVLIMFTMFIFMSIGFDAEILVQTWILPCGAMGAVIISAWLVEAKKSIIENMAPVLTRIFTPLFTILLLVFLGTMIWTGKGIGVDREILIGFDLLLVLVLALLLFSISVRDHNKLPNFFDVLQFMLVVSALLVDILALHAIATRISEFGFSPNRVAALGENLILLVNLVWSAALYAKFLLKRSDFTTVERWQTSYIPVYAIWAWIVVIVFPIVFNFR